MNKTAILIRNQNIVEWKWVHIPLLKIKATVITTIPPIGIKICIPQEHHKKTNHVQLVITLEDLKPA